MTPEELMIPRYKVVADYPKSIHPIGTIYSTGGRSEDLLYCDYDGPRMRDYPHLFKELQWYEERKIEDLPDFIKIKEVVYKVDRWNMTFGAIPFSNSDSLPDKQKTYLSVEWYFYFKQSTPATEQDYITYIQPL